MESTTTIAIIGGGASGTITAIHLLEEFKTPLKIYLLERRQKAVFRGVAYATELEFEPLNVPAGKMSIFSDAPLDFYHWLLENKQQVSTEPITADSYVSRRWFGDYLAERLARSKARAKGALQIIFAEATEITNNSSNQNYRIKLADGTYIKAGYLVFATGNEPPAEALNNLETAILGQNYIPDPWKVHPFQQLSPDDDVLVLGTGLSMVDHVISLRKRNHRGKIFAFSRHGFLPLTQQAGQQGQVTFSYQTSDILNILKDLRAGIADSKKQGVDWQQVINSLRDDTPAIWRGLSPESKRLFLRRLKPFWEIHRHRMPIDSARIIDEMKQTGKLEILHGKKDRIVIEAGRFAFIFTQPGLGIRSVAINHVINCTGPAGNYSGYGNQLIRHLLSRGWMKQDELGLGIETGYSGEIITASGNALPNAFAVGPLRKATEWESTAIREIKIQAEQLALDIALNYTNRDNLSRLVKF